MTHFDFQEWATLHEVDPEAFEVKREATLREIVDSREDDESKRLLEQTLFRIDMTRRKSKSPLQAALLASNIMWESFGKLQEKLNELDQGLQSTEPPAKNSLRIVGTNRHSESFGDKESDSTSQPLHASQSASATVLVFKPRSSTYPK